MTDSATILEFDLFRRLRRTLSAATSAAARASVGEKPADWPLGGFCGKELVGTSFGDLPIEALRPRDELRTYTGQSLPVKAVDRLKLDWGFIRRNPRALPIRIPANSFGPGKPANDLLLSPGQEICPDLHVATTFLNARNLADRFKMDFTLASGLTYFRFHCGVPAIVRVEGIWVRTQPWTDHT